MEDEEEEEQSLRCTGTKLGYSMHSLSRSSIQVKPGKEGAGDKKTSIPCTGRRWEYRSYEPLV